MNPVIFHFVVLGLASLVVWLSRRAFQRAMSQDFGPVLIIEYGSTSRIVTVVGCVIMGIMIAFALSFFEAPTGSELLSLAGVSVGYAIAFLLVLDRRVVLTSEWVSSGMSLFRPKRIPLSAMKGAQVSTTQFFGGVTTISTGVGRLKVWHQMEGYKVMLERLSRTRDLAG